MYKTNLQKIGILSLGHFYRLSSFPFYWIDFVSILVKNNKLK